MSGRRSSVGVVLELPVGQPTEPLGDLAQVNAFTSWIGLKRCTQRSLIERVESHTRWCLGLSCLPARGIRRSHPTGVPRPCQRVPCSHAVSTAARPLPNPRRKRCLACNQVHLLGRAQSARLLTSQRLAQLRQEGADPTSAPEATAKRSASLIRNRAEIDAWREANPGGGTCRSSKSGSALACPSYLCRSSHRP